MSTVEATTIIIQLPESDAAFDEPQLAAAAFLDRYSGRTLDAYRHDLRMFFLPSNPAQYVRRPKVQPSEGHGDGPSHRPPVGPLDR